MRTVSLLGSFLAASLFACATHTTNDGANSAAAATTDDTPGQWFAQVSLRDTTTVDPTLATPDGGWYVTPIHTTLLPDGKIFISGWSRAEKDTCEFPEGSRRNGASWVFDPAVLATQDAHELAIDPLAENVTVQAPWKGVLYCAGHSPVVIDGESQILLTGGSRYLNLGEPNREVEEGIREAHLVHLDTPSIELLPALTTSGPVCKTNDGQELAPGETQARGGKWYATNTRTPDGSVLVTGGFTGGPTSLCADNRHSASAEFFDPKAKTFTALFQPEDLPANFGERFAPGDKDYTHTVLLPEPIQHNGHAYPYAMMGYAGFIVYLSTDPGLAAQDRFYIPPNGSRPDNAQGWDSTMALISTGEILVMGGTNDPNVATKIELYDPKADSWSVVDTQIGRRNAGATLLPDGNVLIINGWRDDSPTLGLDERTKPIIFNPDTRQFKTYDGFTGDKERGYHSFTLLGKDASIYVGGGIYPSDAPAGSPKETDIGCERTDLQMWRPPYLQSASPRPVADVQDGFVFGIGGAPITIPSHGAKLDPKKGAVLMALGSFTHGFDQNQRYVRMTINADGTVTPPANATIAPPGDYMLYLVSDAGIPSTGVAVRVQ